MRVNPYAKKFLEKNFDLLVDSLEEFYMKANICLDLTIPDFYALHMMLIKADVATEVDREKALSKFITKAVSDWADSDDGVSAMLLVDFLSVFLENNFGYQNLDLIQYMTLHKSEWSDYVKIYLSESGKIIIDRNID